ncbi:hypothetical protein [Caulobacter sp. UC70_42]|uniref:hypothetical protein n=1 Tax=Caulobacter sp. UC70_42 TaxID=3374551 RepID=UPI00375807B3
MPGHATTAGAITFTILGAVATAIFLNRKKLAPVSAWAKRHPWRTGALGLIALPFGLYAVTIILMSLTKYLTFASALATTVGVLVALDNNRRSHEREERRLARQEMAARTAFAHALAAIQTYAQEVISAVSVIRRTDPEGTNDSHGRDCLAANPRHGLSRDQRNDRIHREQDGRREVRPCSEVASADFNRHPLA